MQPYWLNYSPAQNGAKQGWLTFLVSQLNMFSRFSSNSEMKASELLENVKEMFPWYLLQAQEDIQQIQLLNPTILCRIYNLT